MLKDIKTSKKKIYKSMTSVLKNVYNDKYNKLTNITIHIIAQSK